MDKILKINGSSLHVEGAPTPASGSVKITATTEFATGGGVSGSGSYKEGQAVTLVATPNDKFSFNKWNDGNTDATHSVMVGNADKEYSASFKYLPGSYIMKNLFTNVGMYYVVYGTTTPILDSSKTSYRYGIIPLEGVKSITTIANAKNGANNDNKCQGIIFLSSPNIEDFISQTIGSTIEFITVSSDDFPKGAKYALVSVITVDTSYGNAEDEIFIVE